MSPVDDGTCWVSIGGGSSLILEDFGQCCVCDVTGLADCPRRVINLEQLMDAPSDEDVRTLVGSSRGEALMERRRRNLVVNRELLVSFLRVVKNWTCLPVHCSRGPRVSQHGVALFSHPLRPKPPPARVFNVDGSSRVIDETISDVLGRAVLVTEDDVILEDVSVHSRSDGSRVRLRMLQTRGCFLARTSGSRVRVVRSHRAGFGDSGSLVRFC